MKETFTLPELWYIVVTEENQKEVSNWRYFDMCSLGALDLPIHWIAGMFDRIGKAHNMEPSPKGKWGIEITYDQFKTHVLKETNMKEIIGWKLTKPEYRNAVRKITGMDSFNFTELEIDKEYAVRNTPNETFCYKELKKAGVLDLWFEPVYKTTYKVGDWITVTHIDSIEDHWLKSTTQRTFKLTKEPSMYLGGMCWSTKGNGGNGIKEEWFRLATPEEIKSLEEETFDMGGFKLTIKSFGIYHGTEDITDFCHRLFVFYSVIPNKFGKYDCIPNEITFKKTGCENTTTKLSDWLNVHRIYNKLKQKMNNES